MVVNEVAHPRQVLFGLTVDAVTLPQAVAIAAQSLQTRSRLIIGVVNAAKVVKLKADAVLRESLLEADLLLADGQSVVWASRLLGRPLPERVTGIDLFEALLDLADREGHSAFLLGARPEVLKRVHEVVADRWPNVRIAGSQDGYFPADEVGSVAERIAASHADMLFIAMGTPTKEIFLGTYGDRLGVPVLHGVGGSFDVLAGVTKRAPERWQRWGMEWAYRVLQEPRRLWRRYLVTNVAFVFLLLAERLKRRPPYELRQATPGGVQSTGGRNG
jgi:N-acetylglucosaminyldiphosphoundecaprenol N-acetyl-beta-D-mannosaminyltransferase